MQEREASPLMCTVQAPHSIMPQPNFVPVICSVSRNTHNSGICGSTSTVVDFPFSEKVTAMSSSGSQEISYLKSQGYGNT